MTKDPGRMVAGRAEVVATIPAPGFCRRCKQGLQIVEGSDQSSKAAADRKPARNVQHVGIAAEDRAGIVHTIKFRRQAFRPVVSGLFEKAARLSPRHLFDRKCNRNSGCLVAYNEMLCGSQHPVSSGVLHFLNICVISSEEFQTG